MAQDFKALLSQNLDSVEKPKAWPAGTYYGKLGKYTPGESGQKKTPYVRFAVVATSPGDDVDQDSLQAALNGKPMAERQFRSDFYLTPEATYRLKEFMVSCGCEVSGRSLAEVLPELPEKDVMFELSMEPSQQNPNEYFNNVVKITGMANAQT